MYYTSLLYMLNRVVEAIQPGHSQLIWDDKNDIHFSMRTCSTRDAHHQVLENGTLYSKIFLDQSLFIVICQVKPLVAYGSLHKSTN